MAPANEKQQAQQLLDQLDAGQLSAVVHLLQVMTDPVARAIARAPREDESISEEEIKALDEAGEWLKHNEPIPHERVLAELGITQEEIDRCNKARGSFGPKLPRPMSAGWTSPLRWCLCRPAALR